MHRFGTLNRYSPFVTSRRYGLIQDVHRHLPSWSTSSLKSSENSNEYLVKARIAAAAARKETRKSYLEQDRQRNLRIKKLLHTSAYNGTSVGENGEGAFQIPQLYAIRVSVDQELRQELKMNGREKRGRVFIERDADGCKSLKGLRYELHSFFRCLKKSSYILSAGLPNVQPDGSILSPVDEKNMDGERDQVEQQLNVDEFADFWEIQNDDDVLATFSKAEEFFESHNSNLSEDAQNRLKRPSIHIYVQKDPSYSPPPMPKYLQSMANPKESKEITMLSFYAFPPDGVKDPEEFQLLLRKLWKPFDALGRIYVATEGINAQMAVPSNVLSNFMECCMEIPELGVHMENGINIDPVPLTLEEFAVAGGMDGKPEPPFRNLHIRVRQKVVADGLDQDLDWQSAGYDMPPMEWHQILQEKSRNRKGDEEEREDDPIILDCRNKYETSVGKFEGAEPLNTENFRDSWDVLKERLKDSPKDKPIMTYCTGGIRCVKVGAYLTQELGFTNVSRLAGGVIAYDRTLNEVASGEEPMFKGTNYVFDGRVGRKITEDKLAECITCGVKTNLISNCMNDNCHKRMAQCETCRSKYHGTCSTTCKTRVEKQQSRMTPLKTPSKVINEESEPQTMFNNTDEYSLGYSTPSPPIFKEIKLNTAEFLGSGIHMISDRAQGRLLSSLASMSREGRVLEIGTFTGYATACFLEGAANVGDILDDEATIGSRESGAYVLSLERDSRAFHLASKHIEAMSKYGQGEEGAREVSGLRNDASLFETNGDDSSVTFSFRKAGCELYRCNDALAVLEAMANGESEVFTSLKAFDLVFIDADKTRFLDYIEACLSSDRVLKRGGYMIVDNVLWKGMVLEAQSTSFVEFDTGGTDKEAKKSRRARKLANIIHKFNSGILNEERTETLMLPIRDGLSLIRKR